MKSKSSVSLLFQSGPNGDNLRARRSASLRKRTKSALKKVMKMLNWPFTL
jgi:hypothetical protein